MQHSAAVRKINRNDPCPCGSGRKFKKCCLPRQHGRSGLPNVPPAVVAQFMAQVQEARFSGPPSIKMQYVGHTLRILWNKLIIRPEKETFHEYIIALLKGALGQKWHDDQMQLDPQHRHVIVRWVYAWHQLAKLHEPTGHKPGEIWGAAPTGEAQELLALADDAYRLQLVKRLPHKLLDRLRSRDGFQGARYEVAIAASFVRTGFEIDWLDEKSKKHCEFIATHKATGEKIAVETKSRHRPGVLHQGGDAPDPRTFTADIEGLYLDALSHNPGDMPFGVFIDVNVPHRPGLEGFEKPWRTQIRDMLSHHGECSPAAPAAYTLLVVTNFAWHFEGGGLAAGHEYLAVVPLYAQYPWKNPDSFQALRRALDKYGNVSADE